MVVRFASRSSARRMVPLGLTLVGVGHRAVCSRCGPCGAGDLECCELDGGFGRLVVPWLRGAGRGG